MVRKVTKKLDIELSKYIVDESTPLLNGSHCHLWTGSTNNSGYGQTWLNGSMKYVHRLAYENKFGKIADGKEMGHLCHNKTCMNPDHLKEMTHQENIQHGYDSKQKRKKIVTLTKDQRLHIIKNENHVSTKDLAKKYDVHEITITRLRKRGK